MSYHIFKTAITNQYEGLGSANAAVFFFIMVAYRLSSVPLPQGAVRVLSDGQWQSPVAVDNASRRSNASPSADA